MSESFAFHTLLRHAVLTHVQGVSMLPSVPSSQPDGHKPGAFERGPTGDGKPTHPGGLGRGSRGEAHPEISIPLRSRLTSVSGSRDGRGNGMRGGPSSSAVGTPELKGVRPREWPDPEPVGPR